MSTNFTLNEPLMIRDRLQEAYRKIIFISDNDFAQDANYKKANQVLYARIKKLEESPEFDRPRAVRDVIPSSNLAKYGQYQYNEARERSYTSSVSDVSLHYPCLYKTDAIKEPWMLPEVEQIFIHTVFTRSFNFKLYEAELEQLEKIDLIEETVPGLVPTCCTGDFHKVNPVMDQLFERAPGKPAGEQNDTAIVPNIPYYFNVKDYADVLLRKKFLSDVVRELWNKPKLENHDKLLKIYKSSLDCIYIEENHFKYVNSLKSIDTERSLQKLVESIISLNEKVPKSMEVASNEGDMSSPEATQPTRRLYSDVVQGNKPPAKQQQEQPDFSPSTLKNVRSVLEDFFVNPAPLDNSNSGPLSPDRIVIAPEPNSKMECKDESGASNLKELVAHNDSSDRLRAAAKYSYSDAVNNVPEVPTSQNGNMVLNDFSLYESRFKSGSSTSFQNFFSPLQYIPSTVYNANYRLGYTSTFTGTFANQQVPANRQALSTNACQQHQWFFPSYRPASLCGYGNFLGQLLVPQIPTKHRWSNPLYGRPPTPQSMYQPVAQSWGIQNVYRSSSSQQMPGYPVYENQKAKAKKTPVTNTSIKFVRSKTTDQANTKNKNPLAKKLAASNTLHLYPGKILTKPSSDYKLMTRHEGEVRLVTSSSSSTRACDGDIPSIPVSCTASDDLEKIALREYQSSNDLFFTEIERQAKEQYDGNPENSCCPPNKALCLGGLAVYECILESCRCRLLNMSPLQIKDPFGPCSFESRRYFII